MYFQVMMSQIIPCIIFSSDGGFTEVDIQNVAAWYV